MTRKMRVEYVYAPGLHRGIVFVLDIEEDGIRTTSTHGFRIALIGIRIEDQAFLVEELRGNHSIAAFVELEEFLCSNVLDERSTVSILSV